MSGGWLAHPILPAPFTTRVRCVRDPVFVCVCVCVCVQYDLLHNRGLPVRGLQRLYRLSKALADVIMPLVPPPHPTTPRLRLSPT